MTRLVAIRWVPDVVELRCNMQEQKEKDDVVFDRTDGSSRARKISSQNCVWGGLLLPFTSLLSSFAYSTPLQYERIETTDQR
jgi:hypothetical protein